MNFNYPLDDLIVEILGKITVLFIYSLMLFIGFKFLSFF